MSKIRRLKECRVCGDEFATNKSGCCDDCDFKKNERSSEDTDGNERAFMKMDAPYFNS